MVDTPGLEKSGLMDQRPECRKDGGRTEEARAMGDGTGSSVTAQSRCKGPERTRRAEGLGGDRVTILPFLS